VAGACADGLISPSSLPPLSRAALLTSEFAEISGLDLALAARPREMPPLRLIFGINVSASADRERARQHARRQVAPLGPNPADTADLRDLPCQVGMMYHWEQLSLGWMTDGCPRSSADEAVMLHNACRSRQCLQTEQLT
jgi:hypothetical protein